MFDLPTSAPRFMLAISLVVGLSWIGGQAVAQTAQPPVDAKQPPAVHGEIIVCYGAGPRTPTPDTTGVYNYAEQMPRFRHGRGSALADFVERNRRWPKELWKTQGRVFVGFVITAEGGVRDAKVLKGLHPTLDAEALRVVQLLDGKFWPAKQDGRAVAVRYTLAVLFAPK